jgi:hypothetical protein
VHTHLLLLAPGPNQSSLSDLSQDQHPHAILLPVDPDLIYLHLASCRLFLVSLMFARQVIASSARRVSSDRIHLFPFHTRDFGDLRTGLTSSISCILYIAPRTAPGLPSCLSACFDSFLPDVSLPRHRSLLGPLLLRLSPWSVSSLYFQV